LGLPLILLALRRLDDKKNEAQIAHDSDASNLNGSTNCVRDKMKEQKAIRGSLSKEEKYCVI